MNGYANIINKNSFAIEVATCNEDWGGENGDSCASEEDIREFVPHIVLT